MDDETKQRQQGHKRPLSAVIQDLEKRIRGLEDHLQRLLPTNSSGAADTETSAGITATAENTTNDRKVRDLQKQLAQYCRQSDITVTAQCWADLQALGAAINWIECIDQAFKSGSVESLQWLLTTGVNPNLEMPDYGPLLLRTVAEGNLAMIELVLAAGADPNLRNACEESPLMLACHLHGPEKMEIVKRLVRAGADPRDPRPDIDGIIPVQEVIGNIIPSWDDKPNTIELALFLWLVESGAPLEGIGGKSMWSILNAVLTNARVIRPAPWEAWQPILDILLPRIPEPSWATVRETCAGLQILAINWWWQRQLLLLRAFGASLSIRHLQTLVSQSSGYTILDKHLQSQWNARCPRPQTQVPFDPFQPEQQKALEVWYLLGWEPEIHLRTASAPYPGD